MIRANSSARLLAFPLDQSPSGGRLDMLQPQWHGDRPELLMQFQELIPSAPPELIERNGMPVERLRGLYVPRCLRFVGARIVRGTELPASLARLPADDPDRAVTGTWQWRNPTGENYYLLGVHIAEVPSLLMTAERCISEPRDGPAQRVDLTRDWSPTPASPARRIPDPQWLHQRYGGDPIPVQLSARLYHRRLFIGGVDVQGLQRPDVHAVLNLGEEPSRWAAVCPPHPADRWADKGEGSQGMDAAEISEEALWVVERLRAGQRVLVHCSAGMNRSATICCAVLELLEGLSAEAALERVRAHHPWARPDSHHWLQLRWLAHVQRAAS